MDVANAIPSDVVLTLANGRPVRAVWRNELGMLTWQIGDGDDREFVKDGWYHGEFEPHDDEARMRWLAAYVPVPEVIAVDTNDTAQIWLHTRGLPGDSAVAPHNVARAGVIVPALGAALRRFHDEVPVASCPFTWSIDDRVAGFLLPRDVDDAPPEDDLVVCHGDACSPNFLFDAAGDLTGYVDVGCAGVADRYADLAPALLSLGWNFGPFWDDVFLAAYGLTDVDADKLAWYQRFWQHE